MEMGYGLALSKAWNELKKTGLSQGSVVRFLADEYALDLESQRVMSLSCNAPAKDFTAILILHYLTAVSRGLPYLERHWVSFRELAGIEGYSAAFRKRAIEPILRKYGNNAEGLLGALKRLPGQRAPEADVGIVLEVFNGVPAMILLWRSDEEFAAEAAMLFDASIKHIFCTEDIAVLAGVIASAL
ncbi:MAG: DUF3786 domain-containing protein [Candidatus Omnitrophota bacterium]